MKGGSYDASAHQPLTPCNRHQLLSAACRHGTAHGTLAFLNCPFPYLHCFTLRSGAGYSQANKKENLRVEGRMRIKYSLKYNWYASLYRAWGVVVALLSSTRTKSVLHSPASVLLLWPLLQLSDPLCRQTEVKNLSRHVV